MGVQYYRMEMCPFSRDTHLYYVNNGSKYTDIAHAGGRNCKSAVIKLLFTLKLADVETIASYDLVVITWQYYTIHNSVQQIGFNPDSVQNLF